MTAQNQNGDLPDSTRLQIEELGEAFIQQWRDGLNPDIEQFVLDHPTLGDQIREIFPAMLFAEQMNPSSIVPKRSFDLELPAELGGFTLIREVGRGGMAIVYEASQENFSGSLAVKVLQNNILRSQNLDDRFVREAEAASRLHHPNIVPPRQYGREGDHHFLAMALIDGLSLDRLMQQSRHLLAKHGDELHDANRANEANEAVERNEPEDLSEVPTPKTISLDLVFERIRSDWNKVARLGAGIASALHHAHENGMIHRDVKPANLILDRDGKVWVTDFGLAKLRDENAELSRSGEMIGTPRYMAPEQLRGTADTRSDIYGIGLTLYELVTGERPWDLFESDNLLVARPMLQTPNVRTLNPGIPKDLADIIMKACEYHPESRYQSARDLEFALNQFAHKGDENRRSGKRVEVASTKFRVAALVVALALIFTWFFVRSEGLFQSIKAQAIDLQTHQSGLNEESSEAIPDGRPKTNCIAYTDPKSGLEHVITRVNARSDDAEEYADGTVNLDSRDLEMTFDQSKQTIGLRFAGVLIPRGATIRHAEITFTCDESNSGKSTLIMHGIADANTKTFRPLSFDITKRSKTEANLIWIPDAWSKGEKRSTPELSDIVQELVDQQNWTSGNAMGFVVDGDGLRSAKSFDYNISRAPTLTIYYEK